MNLVLGNSNGVMTNIYYYLWMKDEFLDNEMNTILIP